MNYPSFLASSQNPAELKLRVKSFALLIVPVLNSLFPGLIPDDIDTLIDAFFVVAFFVAHIYGWVRAKSA